MLMLSKNERIAAEKKRLLP